MESELKIVKAPCKCAKCAPTDRNAAARLASLTRLVALAKAEKPVPPAPPVASPNRVIEYVRSQVPPPPDLNEAIRRAAKEKK